MSNEIISEKLILQKYKELYKIKSFPHTLVQKIFFLLKLWKSCEKFFLDRGNICQNFQIYLSFNPLIPTFS